jgi:hypothetical protein
MPDLLTMCTLYAICRQRKVLLDEKEKMHERYAALFGLRNRGGSDAVAAIVAALKCESALLKHEVCVINILLILEIKLLLRSNT